MEALVMAQLSTTLLPLNSDYNDETWLDILLAHYMNNCHLFNISACLLSVLFSCGVPSRRLLLSVCLCACPADEVYAQKLKGKALSEELDLALNDMTTL